jgi:hypothetical protein
MLHQLRKQRVVAATAATAAATRLRIIQDVSCLDTIKKIAPIVLLSKGVLES